MDLFLSEVRPGVQVAPADHRAIERVRHPGARAKIATRRMLTRTALGRRLDLEPVAVEITRTCVRCGHLTHGRPRVVGGPEFSASATHEVAVVAIAGCPVGADVERLDRVPADEADDIARSVLTRSEARRFTGLCADRSRALVEAWSRKEAVGKASGIGAGDAAIVDVGPPVVLHDGHRWWVTTLWLTSQTVLSIATARPHRPLTLSTIDLTPPQGREPASSAGPGVVEVEEVSCEG